MDNYCILSCKKQSNQLITLITCHGKCIVSFLVGVECEKVLFGVVVVVDERVSLHCSKVDLMHL